MVMAQSLFIALKKRHPNALIDVLAMDWTRPLLQRMPEVNKAISMPVTHGVFGWKQRKQIGKQLQQENYDQAIVLPNSWKSALIPWFAKIPLRTGWRGELRFGLLNDIRKLNKSALPMMVQRFVSLAYPKADSQLAPSYPEPVMHSETPATDINPERSPQQKRLVLCPGAEFGPAKQWPASHFAALADFFMKNNWQILLLGSKADFDVAEQIKQCSAASAEAQIHNLAGHTSLAQAIDLIGTADCVVSNDSGLMHIAAALQKPIVAVYGPTSTAFTPPLSSKAAIAQIDIDCSPCFERTCPLGHHRCMQDLTAESVINKIKTLIHEHV